MENGGVYTINTDFRAGVAFCTAVQRGETIQKGKLLSMFYPEKIPTDTDAAVQAVLAWIRCGRELSGEHADGSPPYDLLTDADAICTAFLQAYRIDITAAKMHWWRFVVLLRGHIEPPFERRVQIRTTDLGKIKDRDKRVQVQRLKEIYALDRRGRPMKAPTTLEEYEALLLAQARGER